MVGTEEMVSGPGARWKASAQRFLLLTRQGLRTGNRRANDAGVTPESYDEDSWTTYAAPGSEVIR